MYLLVTTSEPPTQQDNIDDLFIFLLRYSFMQNDATKSQNSCASKTTQLNATQGNIYMGTRYLDPKYSRWISTDPALGEYIPAAGKGNSENAGNLPGMGGIYNHINGDLYAYAANNPVRYVDPDGNYVIMNESQKKRTECFIHTQKYDSIYFGSNNQNLATFGYCFNKMEGDFPSIASSS